MVYALCVLAVMYALVGARTYLNLERFSIDFNAAHKVQLLIGLTSVSLVGPFIYLFSGKALPIVLRGGMPAALSLVCMLVFTTTSGTRLWNAFVFVTAFYAAVLAFVGFGLI